MNENGSGYQIAVFVRRTYWWSVKQFWLSRSAYATSGLKQVRLFQDKEDVTKMFVILVWKDQKALGQAQESGLWAKIEAELSQEGSRCIVCDREPPWNILTELPEPSSEALNGGE